MAHEQEQQLQELLLPNHKIDYFDDDVPKTTNIGWLKNYFRGHFLPSIKRNILTIIFFSICLLILLGSQRNSNDDGDNEIGNIISNITSIEDENYNHFPSISKYEKFMSYLPHGDIFQQREELANAIFLAYSLNRTLIIPPIILGLNIKFTTSQELREKLNSLHINKHQSECFVKTTIPEQRETKYEIDMNCLSEFDSYSLLRWDSLSNLSSIKNEINILHRKDFDQIKLGEMLNITNSKRDIFEITTSKQLLPDSIRWHEEKLLSFDYLLGKDLIKKGSIQDQLFWRKIDSSLTLNNPTMLDVSSKIIQKLGGTGNYVGVHARLYSTSNSKKSIQISLKKLALILKKEFNETSQGTSCNISSPSSHIIYLATDLNRNNTILSSFLSQFSCVTMLSDFNEILLPLLEFYNPRDGTFLFKFLEPLVNSIVASSGVKLYSVDDGIYSEYAKQLHNEPK